MSFSPFRKFLALALCVSALAGGAAAQQQRQAPLTNAEFLALVRQLPQHPGVKDQLLAEIRRRGIGFALTPGLRDFVATKSGNDVELKRVLEEAERRFRNPSEARPLPPEAETASLLERARLATLEATTQMPDFVVKQLVTRSYAQGRSQNWHVVDRLVVGVSYRPSEGEKYRLLQVNGARTPDAGEKSDYNEAGKGGGATSTGEFVSHLKALFEEASQTEFKALDTDTLRGRRTVVYSYNIKRANSRWQLETESAAVISALRGKVWIDAEKARVLRIEFESYDVPDTFPIQNAVVELDYDWVTIPTQGEYLLPSRSVNVLTTVRHGETSQARNEIRFRNYQKYGTELKILDDDIIDEDVPAEQPQQTKPPEKKP
ncbi:MAG: hypothetical protein JOZ96_06225 [Acidobacteria bacterium]|nr:hypothetical protein [Acidobacteriota bacterium]